jgi:hypothetical protein
MNNDEEIINLNNIKGAKLNWKTEQLELEYKSTDLYSCILYIDLKCGDMVNISKENKIFNNLLEKEKEVKK